MKSQFFLPMAARPPSSRPIPFRHLGGADGVFDEVVVDLDAAVFEVEAQRGPLAEGVVDGLAEEALGKGAAAELEGDQRSMQTDDDGTALMRAVGEAQARPGVFFTQVFFHTVKVRDLPEDPAGGAWGLVERFVELAPGMRTTAGEGNFAGAPFGKGGIGAVAIALQGAGEVGGDDVIQADGGAAGSPVKEHVAAGSTIGPKIALSGFPMTRIKIADRGFIDLHIASGHDSSAHRFVDRPQPVCRETNPAHHALPRKIDTVPDAIDLLLPVKWKVVAVFGDEDLREQPPAPPGSVPASSRAAGR